MDSQKEIEAFEDWYCKNHTGLKQSDLAKFRTLSGYSFSDSLKINISWEAWQAAKAKAIPEGFVVVPKVPTQKMLDATINVPIPAVYVDSISGQHKLNVAAYYKAMINEAQEQASD